jgi:protein TonB
MNKRKSKSIEKRRILNIEVGLVAALSLLLVAFNWNSNTPAVENLGAMIDTPIEDILIQTTKREEIKKPELPKERHIEIFKIVDNTDIEDDIEIETEFNEKEALKDTKIDMGEEEEFEEPDIFVKIPEKAAEFNGGLEALYAWLGKELRFPEGARINNFKGKVYVEFKIGTNGEVYDITIRRSPDELLSQEVLRVISKMPNWKPAMQGGRKVITAVTIPVNFSLK